MRNKWNEKALFRSLETSDGYSAIITAIIGKKAVSCEVRCGDNLIAKDTRFNWDDAKAWCEFQIELYKQALFKNMQLDHFDKVTSQIRHFSPSATIVSIELESESESVSYYNVHICCVVPYSHDEIVRVQISKSHGFCWAAGARVVKNLEKDK